MKRSRKAARHWGRLTLKQSRFCMAYVETCNGAEAYRRAYDCANMSQAAIHTEALRLLAEPKIKAAIAQLQAAHRKRHDVTVDRVLLELARIGYSDIRNVLDWGPAVAVLDIQGKAEDEVASHEDGVPVYKIMHGLALKAAADLTPDIAASIAEISQAKDGTLKIKLHDKGKALTDMQRYLGMHKDAVRDDAAAAVAPDAPRSTGDDHLADLARRYAGGLKVVQGGKTAT